MMLCFFFQAEDGIRDYKVTGVQTVLFRSWVAQHHFLNNGARLPSTLAFLAAAAQRTRRIHLGTAIVILPLEDPLRVAEDRSEERRVGKACRAGGGGTPAVERTVSKQRSID